MAFNGKELLIILLFMVCYLASESLGRRNREQWKQGRCRETQGCIDKGGHCYKNSRFCKTPNEITYECYGGRNCVCCIPEPSAKECVDRNGDTNECNRYIKHCERGSRHHKWMSKFCRKTCGFCTRGTEGNRGCPKCGMQFRSNFGRTPADFIRIVGGVEIKPPHNYPWLVLMKSYFRVKENPELDSSQPSTKILNCGGQIINKRYVLTAAHCVFYDPENGLCYEAYGIKVHVGLHRIDLRDAIKGVTREIKISKIKVHDDYIRCGTNHSHDIALLRLDEDLDLESDYQRKGIGAICLPKNSYKDYNPAVDVGIAAGWGATHASRFDGYDGDKVPQPVPSEVRLDIGRELCYSNYPTGLITDNLVCAGKFGRNKDSCKGDSGGPLMMQSKNGAFELVGVASFGPPGGVCIGAGAYTRVNQYLDWIAQNTRDIDCNMLYDD